jgi:hypothetical protein
MPKPEMPRRWKRQERDRETAAEAKAVEKAKRATGKPNSGVTF